MNHLTILSNIVCVLVGLYLGYRWHTPPEPAAPSTQQTVKRDLTAKTITETVTKYIPIVGAAPGLHCPATVKESVTHTVYSEPRESVHATDMVAPGVSPASRYSLGIGSSSIHPSWATIEAYGSMRLFGPVSIYSTFQPASTRLSIGVRYDF